MDQSPAHPRGHRADHRHVRDIVVIGASAGAVPTLRALVGALPSDLPASLFVVVHTSPNVRSELAAILSRSGPLPARMPEDNDRFEPRQIYVASPDCHMLLERERVRIVRGPKENRHRPAIDPLFRSAAWSYGRHVVGVVLTGLLDDGAAGLWAIRTCGGVTVVQDPDEAMHPEMPQNALSMTRVDHVLTIPDIANLLVRLAHEPVGADRGMEPPASLRTEVEFATMERDRDIRDMGSLGKLSPFTCPACRGALWELQEDDMLRYRCHTGHAFSAGSLLDEQTSSME